MTDPSVPPSAAELKEVALGYLARYAATETGVRRILMRRVDKWRSKQADVDQAILQNLQEIVGQVVAGLVRNGYLNDREFAATKGRSLRRDGRSTRTARAKLLLKGVPAALAREALPDDPTADLAAAVTTARRRRLGPFRPASRATSEDAARDLARLLRAGFSMAIARRALGMTPEEAEALLQDVHER
ncbi:MAG TPA: RecX family transcriptional regulator [Rhodopila sp.]|uniref:regulatory protein RecX n=1 Tax=Rhodopila sp. TaxID=2480087 RepID=UPI002C9F675F|nr:RecX family transcriptional regulator [Rhodopila sp.]HVY16909.1 RecX family transcriptional regulator [Rhodopila sp.]